MFTPIQRVSAIGLFLVSIVFTNVASAELRWHRSPDQAMQAAQASGKPILVFVTTDWCHYCQKMKRETWGNVEFSSAVDKHFEGLLLDGDRDKTIVGKLGIRSYPATLVFDSGGAFVSKKSGFMTPTETAQWLRQSTQH